jgi:uncharacterized protein (DUF2141 family)
MKTWNCLTIIFIVFSLQPVLVSAQTASLQVSVNNIKSKKGSIRIGLFTENEFLKTAFEGKIVKATTDGVTVVFENLKEGVYAVSVIHDENENGVLDTNKLGIPKEGFAFGNNAMGTFGPPAFEEAKIEIHDQPVKQELKMKYM